MNQQYKQLRALLAILTDGEVGMDDMIIQALTDYGKSVSKSRLQGWRVAESSRHHYRMTVEEFSDLLTALIAYFEHDSPPTSHDT
jgi:hypothetical protein